MSSVVCRLLHCTSDHLSRQGTFRILTEGDRKPESFTALTRTVISTPRFLLVCPVISVAGDFLS